MESKKNRTRESIVPPFVDVREEDDKDGARIDKAKIFIVKKYSVIYRLHS